MGLRCSGGAGREVIQKDVCNAFLINQDVIECVCVCVHGYLWEIPTVSNTGTGIQV